MKELKKIINDIEDDEEIRLLECYGEGDLINLSFEVKSKKMTITLSIKTLCDSQLTERTIEHIKSILKNNAR